MRNVICSVLLLVFLYAYWRLMSWGFGAFGIIFPLGMIGVNLFMAYLVDSGNSKHHGREPG